MSFSCVFFGAFWLDPGEGCENIRAAAPACSLARALRALAGGLSWERLGRLALLGNASEILAKNAPGSLPELTLALLGLLFALLGVIWGLLGLVLELLWASWDAPGVLPGRSREPLKSFLALQKLPEALPEAPRSSA